jgi:hypothetical protein
MRAGLNFPCYVFLATIHRDTAYVGLFVAAPDERSGGPHARP